MSEEEKPPKEEQEETHKEEESTATFEPVVSTRRSLSGSEPLLAAATPRFWLTPVFRSSWKK